VATQRDADFRLEFEDWERAAIEYWARKAPESSQQEELRAELVQKLVVLKTDHRPGIRHPKAYIRTALANEAKAWLKKLNVTKRILSLDPRNSEDVPGEPAQALFREPGRDEGDFGLAFQQFWEDLSPTLQRFLSVLEQKNWKLSAAARALRIHRNTAALWLKKVREYAVKHGLGD